MLSYDQTKSLIIIPPTFEFSWNDFSQNKSHVQVVSWVGSLVVAPIHCRKQVPEDLYILSSKSLHGRHVDYHHHHHPQPWVVRVPVSPPLHLEWLTIYAVCLGHLLHIRFEESPKVWQFGQFGTPRTCACDHEALS